VFLDFIGTSAALKCLYTSGSKPKRRFPKDLHKLLDSSLFRNLVHGKEHGAVKIHASALLVVSPTKLSHSNLDSDSYIAP
jgi:hypothetical protein